MFGVSKFDMPLRWWKNKPKFHVKLSWPMFETCSSRRRWIFRELIEISRCWRSSLQRVDINTQVQKNVPFGRAYCVCGKARHQVCQAAAPIESRSIAVMCCSTIKCLPSNSSLCQNILQHVFSLSVNMSPRTLHIRPSPFLEGSRQVSFSPNKFLATAIISA